MIGRVKKNDTVLILSGKDKEKKGEVIAIPKKKGKILVKGIALVTRHVKARKAGEFSGIRKEESFINLSNVIPICTSCKKPCRINSKLLDTGKKVRICNRCKEIF